MLRFFSIFFRTLCFETETIKNVAEGYLELMKDSLQNDAPNDYESSFDHSTTSKANLVFPGRQEILPVILPSSTLLTRSFNVLTSDNNDFSSSSSENRNLAMRSVRFAMINAIKCVNRNPDDKVHSAALSMSWAGDMKITGKTDRELRKILQSEIIRSTKIERSPEYNISISFRKDVLPDRHGILPTVIKCSCGSKRNEKLMGKINAPMRNISAKTHALMSTALDAYKGKIQVHALPLGASKKPSRCNRHFQHTTLHNVDRVKESNLCKRVVESISHLQIENAHSKVVMKVIEQRELYNLYNDMDVIRKRYKSLSTKLQANTGSLRQHLPKGTHESDRNKYLQLVKSRLHVRDEVMLEDDPISSKPILPYACGTVNIKQMIKTRHYRNEGCREIVNNQSGVSEMELADIEDLIEISQVNDNDNPLPDQIETCDYDAAFQENKGDTKQPEVLELKVIGSSIFGKAKCIPDETRCSVWSRNVAAHCLSLKEMRGILISPPSTSMLPTLICLMQSHLNKGVDNRVAIICDGDRDDFIYIHSLLRAFMRNVSISVVGSNIAEYDLDDGIDALSITSKIVIVDRLSTRLASSYSLLLILISVPSLMGSRVPRRPFQRLRIQDANRWKLIKSIIIAPMNTWTSVEDFLSRAEMYATKLNISKVLYSSFNNRSRSLSVGKALLIPGCSQTVFVQPPSDAISMAKVLEEEGCCFMNSYNVVERQKRWNTISTFIDTIQRASKLDDVSVTFLRDYMSQLEDWDETTNEIAQLSNIKQAHLYALHDGAETAKEFLDDCIRKHPSRKKLFDRLNGSISRQCPHLFTQRSEMEIDATEYWMTKVLREVFVKSIRIMRGNVEESLNETSTRRYRQFRPLVITDSSEALDKLKNADLTVPLEGVVHPAIVIKWDQVGDETVKIEKGLDLDEVSHIFHLTDGRSDAVPDYRLSNEMLENVIFGWQTHLITVQVDPSGELSRRWDEDRRAYIKFGEEIRVGSGSNINEERSSTTPILETTVSKVNECLRKKTKGSEQNGNFNQRQALNHMAPGMGVQNETRSCIRLNEENDDVQIIVPRSSKESGRPSSSQNIHHIKTPRLKNQLPLGNISTTRNATREAVPRRVRTPGTRLNKSIGSSSGIRMEIDKMRPRKVRVSAKNVIRNGVDWVRSHLNKELIKFYGDADQEEDVSCDPMEVEITTGTNDMEGVSEGGEYVAMFILNHAIGDDSKLRERCKVTKLH